MGNDAKNPQRLSATLSDSPAPQQFPPTPSSKSETVSSQSVASATINIFSLCREIRNNIYKRVLIVRHPLFIFQDTGSRVEIFAPDRPVQWLALLYINRQMHSEACAVFYGMNQFTLVDTTPQQSSLLRSFLGCIGSQNAGFLSHLCINFPVTEDVEGRPGEFKVRGDDLQSLELLQQRCTHLTTLETLIHNKNSGGLTKIDQETSQFMREKLSQIDVQLKAISSLKKVIVRVYDGTPTPPVRELMQGFGWTVMLGNKTL